MVVAVEVRAKPAVRLWRVLVRGARFVFFGPVLRVPSRLQTSAHLVKPGLPSL